MNPNDTHSLYQYALFLDYFRKDYEVWHDFTLTESSECREVLQREHQRRPNAHSPKDKDICRSEEIRLAEKRISRYHRGGTEFTLIQTLSLDVIVFSF